MNLQAERSGAQPRGAVPLEIVLEFQSAIRSFASKSVGHDLQK
jgi:hypothetical protein